MPHSISESLDDERRYALSAIDNAAARARARHLTAGADAEYAIKAAEADAIRSGAETSTPVIDAEAEAAGECRADRAERVIAAATRCTRVAHQIAEIRGPARARVQAASTAACIAQTRQSAVAALNTI